MVLHIKTVQLCFISWPTKHRSSCETAARDKLQFLERGKAVSLQFMHDLHHTEHKRISRCSVFTPITLLGQDEALLSPFWRGSNRGLSAWPQRYQGTALCSCYMEIKKKRSLQRHPSLWTAKSCLICRCVERKDRLDSWWLQIDQHPFLLSQKTCGWCLCCRGWSTDAVSGAIQGYNHHQWARWSVCFTLAVRNLNLSFRLALCCQWRHNSTMVDGIKVLFPIVRWLQKAAMSAQMVSLGQAV